MSDRVLNLAEAEQYYKALNSTPEKLKCRWCNTSLDGEPIRAYPHSAGWTVEGIEGKQWLYIVCPRKKCGYQWAIWKLGVPRQ